MRTPVTPSAVPTASEALIRRLSGVSVTSKAPSKPVGLIFT